MSTISDARIMEIADASWLSYFPGWVHDPARPTRPRPELRRFVDMVCEEAKLSFNHKEMQT